VLCSFRGLTFITVFGGTVVCLTVALRRENTLIVLSDAASGLVVAFWNFILLVASLLPNLGARIINILAVIAVVFITIYIFISRGWGDYVVRTTQMAVIGLIFPNATAIVKEF